MPLIAYGPLGYDYQEFKAIDDLMFTDTVDLVIDIPTRNET